MHVLGPLVQNLNLGDFFDFFFFSCSERGREEAMSKVSPIGEGDCWHVIE